MHVIFVRTAVPYPVLTGPEKRSYPILLSLIKRHQVTLVCYCTSDIEKENINKLLEIHPELNVLIVELLEGLTGWSEMGENLKRINPDVIFYDNLSAHKMFRPLKNVPYFLNEHNIEFIRYDRERNIIGGISAEHITRLREKEISLCKKASKVFVCSEHDKQELIKYTNQNNIYVIPNIIMLSDYTYKTEYRINKVRLIYVGNLSYITNIDAIRWFTDNIWGLLKSSISNIEMIAAGHAPDKDIIKLGKEKGIQIIGDVEDLNYLLQSCDIAVIPLRIGGGTRLKILEAMTIGLPVITTKLGAEGLEVEDGVHVLFAENAEEFLSAVTRLIHDIDLRDTLIREARTLIIQKYSDIELEKVIEEFFIL